MKDKTRIFKILSFNENGKVKCNSYLDFMVFLNCLMQRHRDARIFKTQSPIGVKLWEEDGEWKSKRY